jgi:L-seryl-tRNA(Ser) seleniumtransferase
LAARVCEVAPEIPASVATSRARTELDRLRRHLDRDGRDPGMEALVEAVILSARLLLAPAPQPVINAAGVIVHTNLGRAPLSDRAIAALQEAARGYSDLEYDVAGGRRGSRRAHVEDLLCELTGAEAALVVNNNAGAVYLCLAALAGGGEVPVSRGEAVEIGGGFRIPDILGQSGAILRDVGTTNRTRLADYAAAIGPDTALLLRVHTSNFLVVGFTEGVPLEDLCALGDQHSVPVMNDLGSGTLLATAGYGLDPEPTVPESVAAGAALTTFSGDKLLGGPQAGIIVGRRDLVDAVAAYPLTRALRPDKLCLAALHATLLAYVEGVGEAEIPVWRMIATPIADLERRAQAWAAALGTGFTAQVIPAEATVGGGSLPGQAIPSVALRIVSPDHSPDELAAALRAATPPIVGRIEADAFQLSPRTVLEREDAALIAALREL